MKYNVVLCCYDKMLVNVAVYVITGYVCMWCVGQDLTSAPHPPPHTHTHQTSNYIYSHIYQHFITAQHYFIVFDHFSNPLQVPVAARSKAWVCGRLPSGTAGFESHRGAWISVCCECCVLSGRGLCDELITRPEESYRLLCVVVCGLETSRMRWP